MISSAIMEQVDVIFHSVVSELFGPEFTVYPEQKEAVFSVLCALPKGHWSSFPLVMVHCKSFRDSWIGCGEFESLHLAR